MEKYKVCPNCGEHNNPIFIECSNCGTDLMTVKVVDEVTENITYEPETETPMVKICECGAENPDSAKFCYNCGCRHFSTQTNSNGIVCPKCGEENRKDTKF